MPEQTNPVGGFILLVVNVLAGLLAPFGIWYYVGWAIFVSILVIVWDRFDNSFELPKWKKIVLIPILSYCIPIAVYVTKNFSTIASAMEKAGSNRPPLQ